ncbi:hypothetical protein FSP39_018332 [Pinctada imbricata]|uniref:phosphoethanolamine N-methyltransferase n=1 Tax=Pinctada imbricata TaxID=66713 RepID=A0AA89BPK6_PINIB|nr:hypothetical protein FSP39_018332 [Pinctada imbricata]
MEGYWKEHSQQATLEEMMLDSNASTLCVEEQPEIMSYLPDYAGKQVVELGAGIGRFTTEFAEKARKVVAVDFMENFIQKNKEATATYRNVEHRCSDVTKLKLPENSTDLVFSNWLLMYLTDKEVQELVAEILKWLKEDAYLFARESCFHQSGNKDRSFNPTKYREPGHYEALFTSATIPTDDPEVVYGLDLVLQKPLQAYYKMKQNDNQIVWLLQKSRRSKKDTHGYTTFQEFLDKQQYSSNGILRYEKIFGRTYVSTGGADTTKEFVEMLNLKKGEVVLDVGCGIGGSAFYMVKEFGVQVVAIDLSSNMIKIGMERAKEVDMSPLQVQFEVADATKRDYPAASFDVVYSRDTILHIPDKLSLFKRFFKYLRPGGRVLISDYCCSEGPHAEDFKAYVKQRGYNLLSPAKYGEVLEEAGFVNVRADDRTDLFVESLKKEIRNTEKIKDEFIQEFCQEDYDYIINGWKDKIQRTGKGDQRWGLFYAEKPL